jgi:hypothetical protein
VRRVVLSAILSIACGGEPAPEPASPIVRAPEVAAPVPATTRVELTGSWRVDEEWDESVHLGLDGSLLYEETTSAGGSDATTRACRGTLDPARAAVLLSRFLRADLGVVSDEVESPQAPVLLVRSGAIDGRFWTTTTSPDGSRRAPPTPEIAAELAAPSDALLAAARAAIDPADCTTSTR